MASQLSVLFIEDNQNDCDLLRDHIETGGFLVTSERVESEKEMRAAFSKNKFDVILCDHNLPEFDVFSALTLANVNMPNVPFIVVSGAVSEGVAVQTVKAGAKDYILKQNLSRLIPAISRELLEAQHHLLHLKVEEELRKKELELRQAQKLEAVGQLAGGIAHDFNNILAIILMQAESTLGEIESNQDLKRLCVHIYKNVEQIKKSGNRAANLTRQLLTFSRKQVILAKVLNINELIYEMEKMLSRLIPENIALELELDPDVKNIKIDPGHFEQIIVNLVVNSKDAMSKGGKITIKTENAVLSELADDQKSEPTRYTLLRVIDTGCGMSNETLQHVFDPFFTTKEVGKGTGLGLSTVYGIIKQNNGHIFIKTKINVGTTFELYFPQTNENVQIPAVSLVPSEDLQGWETIIVAEDETDLRALLTEALERKGYHVLSARDGGEAMELLTSYKKPIHLILTDAVMPRASGPELFEKAKLLGLKSKFLFLSGHTNDILIQQGVNSGESFFLEKPFSMKSLLGKVRAVLNENS